MAGATVAPGLHIHICMDIGAPRNINTANHRTGVLLSVRMQTRGVAADMLVQRVSEAIRHRAGRGEDGRSRGRVLKLVQAYTL